VNFLLLFQLLRSSEQRLGFPLLMPDLSSPNFDAFFCPNYDKIRKRRYYVCMSYFGSYMYIGSYFFNVVAVKNFGCEVKK
jgi:hypothetical protein